jgi:hypothetical protein
MSEDEEIRRLLEENRRLRGELLEKMSELRRRDHELMNQLERSLAPHPPPGPRPGYCPTCGAYPQTPHEH